MGEAYSDVTHMSIASIESCGSSAGDVSPLTIGALPFWIAGEGSKSLVRAGASASSVDWIESFADGE